MMSNSDSSSSSPEPTAADSETHGMAPLSKWSSRPPLVCLISAWERGIAASIEVSGKPQNRSPAATTTTFWSTIDIGRVMVTVVPCPRIDSMWTTP